MEKAEFVNKLFDDCGDDILESDFDVLIDYLNNHGDDVSEQDLISVFLSLASELLDKNEVEAYKQKLGFYTSLCLANSLGVDALSVDNKLAQSTRNRSDHLSRAAFFKISKDPKFGFVDKIIIEKDVDYLPIAYVSVSCNQLIVKGDSSDGRKFELPIKCDSLVLDTYADSLHILLCKKIEFTKNSVVNKNNDIISVVPTFKSDLPNELQEIYLPPVPGVQIPRWMCTTNTNLTIYKAQGVPVKIFSIYKGWLKEHVKSI